MFRWFLIVAGLVAILAYVYQRGSPEYEDVAVAGLWSEYDFVIVGAGSAGGVLAARLSENGQHTVLLLESGGHDDLEEIKVPLAASRLPDTKMSWRYMADSDLNETIGDWKYGRQTHWIAGKGLGGSSSLNWMMYTRGNAEDYNSWARNGADGWSYDDVLPYFKKAESFTSGSHGIDDGYHGKDGPLPVMIPKWLPPASIAILDAASEAGYGVTQDYNGETQLGFSRSQYTIKGGKRAGVAEVYLRPAWHRPNLHILTEAHVAKVMMADSDGGGKKAVGVEFYPPASLSTRLVKARKEVILSAGAVGSAKILLLSGVGPRDELAKHNISVVKELNVGMNLQDHVLCSIDVTLGGPYGYTLKDVESPKTLIHYLLTGTGPLATSGLDITGFVRTKVAVARNSSRPDIQYYLMCQGGDDEISTRMPNMRKEFVSAFTRATGAAEKTKKGVNSCLLLPNVLQPKSTGTVTLRSANPFETPVIKPRYYSAAVDLDVMVEALKIGFELLRSEAFQTVVNPGRSERFFAKAEALASFVCGSPNFDSEECMRKYIPYTSSTGWHYAGTCKMGPASDKTAVVDNTLSVHGVRGLRVVDASIMPTVVSGNTNAPTIMIAEKAADIINAVYRL